MTFYPPALQKLSFAWCVRINLACLFFVIMGFWSELFSNPSVQDLQLSASRSGHSSWTRKWLCGHWERSCTSRSLKNNSVKSRAPENCRWELVVAEIWRGRCAAGLVLVFLSDSDRASARVCVCVCLSNQLCLTRRILYSKAVCFKMVSLFFAYPTSTLVWTSQEMKKGHPL